MNSMTFVPDSVQEVQEIVKSASDNKSVVLAVGGNTQIDISDVKGDPNIVSTKALNSVIEYEPRDLVIVAQAGITLTDIQSTLAKNNQILPIEVASPDKQTLGGIVASRANSLTRAANGSVRDWLIGCHVINAETELVVAGGKVVKNVAGYDLPKLYCGSWGTLGIITQVAFKLAPKPETSKLLLLTLSSERNSEDLLDNLIKSVSPTFTYLLNSKAAKTILGDNTLDAQFLAVGFDGFADEIEILIKRTLDSGAQHIHQAIELPDHVGVKFRERLRDLDQADAPLRAHCNILPSQVGAFARMLEWTANRAGLESIVFADTSTGLVNVHISTKEPVDLNSEDEVDAMNLRFMRLMDDFRDKCTRVGGSTVIKTMPHCWREAGYPRSIPDTNENSWNAKIKNQLDPNGIFPSYQSLFG
jgi:glycolate oxidase FAD binding subunit